MIQDLKSRKIKEIGIPRALSYFKNFPFYKGFFEALGISIVLSDKTTSKTINAGCSICAAETCLPVKVYAGHVLNLLDKGVYNIFIPSLQSNDYKINSCSKIRGLPDIIRNVINRPFNIIAPELNITEHKDFHYFCRETALALGITDKSAVKKAEAAGWAAYNKFIEKTQKGISFNEAPGSHEKIELNYEAPEPLSVVISAHGYNLFDERISLNLIKKLEKMNVKIYTHLNVSKEAALKSINNLGEVIYWANEYEITGAAAYFMQNEKIDGIIALSAFGCGPDSLMIDEIKFHASKRGIPLLNLTIDEHTGEAGFVTRLEAFCDMLLRKKRRSLEFYKELSSLRRFSKKQELQKAGSYQAYSNVKNICADTL